MTYGRTQAAPWWCLGLIHHHLGPLHNPFCLVGSTVTRRSGASTPAAKTPKRAQKAAEERRKQPGLKLPIEGGKEEGLRFRCRGAAQQVAPSRVVAYRSATIEADAPATRYATLNIDGWRPRAYMHVRSQLCRVRDG